MLQRLILSIIILFSIISCDSDIPRVENNTAKKEQAQTEIGHAYLLANQPPVHIKYSLERENINKRILLQNERSVSFYLYIFLEGVGCIGYYQVNKISSVNSQITNPEQMVSDPNTYYQHAQSCVLPSPSEDGSYGTNGDGVFGFTPEDVYIEQNMRYIASTAPLNLKVPKLSDIDLETAKKIKTMMASLGK